jgi:hypothetical protein
LTGDGVTDDTAAINAAISAGGRCGRGCASTTTTPAVVYFPAGSYVISSSIVDYYYTQIIGNPNSPPTLKATSSFSGFGLVDGDPYYTENLNWGSTNVFMRQIRNFVFDLTAIPATSQATGIHVSAMNPLLPSLEACFFALIFRTLMKSLSPSSPDLLTCFFLVAHFTSYELAKHCFPDEFGCRNSTYWLVL